MKVLFETKKVQKSGRIALSEQVLRNAGLQEGAPVDVFFDASSKCIILQRPADAPKEASEPATSATKQKRKLSNVA
ncbi:hypothetical protein AAFF27_11025 [Xylophilus sp. GW821-FHT01B05]